MPDRPDYFRCPICRGVTCERVAVRRPNGSTYMTSFYSCTVCTVMFRDPLALTRGYEDRPRTSPRSAAKGTTYQAWAKINQGRKNRD